MKENNDDFYNYSSESMICAKCNVPLEREKVTLEYLGSSSPVELPKCPKCNNIFIDESLVYSKMLRVEKALEDK
ncbi:DVU_1557 family redox protein [Terrisporobacter mayombei]|uniref:DUF7479 domain-containing protein n=1 Tax=Terrisporobacter mayombei TaxID=1541 RepID=A0ABY9Q6H1_9FIRM|nr:CLJU_RS11820 family redox protein [Terrisporobacter mayombei]MCC3870328.1 hypothetical protein [Terrisporobacter mayombei]WMT83602.1 hypothetical protein TEMA_41210 [Terrisporobacter mayombei]